MVTVFWGRGWLATIHLVKAAKYTAMRPLGFTWGDYFVGVMQFKQHDWSKGPPR